jgi:putative nucleotide binding protein
MIKEEYAIILEYLPNGYPLEKKMLPIAQALGEKNFTLLEIIPRKGMNFSIGEKVYIGDGKRDKVSYILGRLNKEKITESAKNQIQEEIKKMVKESEKKFIEFFNKADAINKRLHQIELIPGLGKKHMQEILKQREEKNFESFGDMKNRIQNLPDPEKAIQKRIFQELTEDERYKLFIN